MKVFINKKWLVLIVATALFSACDNSLQFQPTNQLSNEIVAGSPALLANVTTGNYSYLKEPNYVRMRHIMQEYPGDNVMLSGSTSDHLLYSYNYGHVVNSNVSLNFWRTAYYGIYGTNVVIESIDDNDSEELRQLKGENLFLRALMHFDLLRGFARPYSQNPDSNLGVMIRDNTDASALPARSTVRESYEFVVNDLLKAAELMTDAKDPIYATREAAWALLARAYLYMERYDQALEYADKVIQSGRYQLLETSRLGEYFTYLPEANPETIFAIKHLSTENRGRSSIGSMYHGDGGWGEIYASKPYRDLLDKYPHDERHKFIEPAYILDEEGNRIPDPSEDVGYLLDKRNGISKYFITKYTRQENIPMLSSPVVLRLAEMYLIKAEAYANLPGRESEALEMVNVIRERAGLSGSDLYTTGDLKGHNSVLDVVLEERWLELAWEGHRAMDQFRNNRPIDRRYTNAGAWSGPEVIQPDSPSIVHLIPEAELTLNPNLVQNPN